MATINDLITKGENIAEAKEQVKKVWLQIQSYGYNQNELKEKPIKYFFVTLGVQKSPIVFLRDIHKMILAYYQDYVSQDIEDIKRGGNESVSVRSILETAKDIADAASDISKVIYYLEENRDREVLVGEIVSHFMFPLGSLENTLYRAFNTLSHYQDFFESKEVRIKS